MKRRTVLYTVLALFLLSCCCVAVLTQQAGSKTGQAVPTAKAIVTERPVAYATEPDQPTDTPTRIDTPTPADTPLPTAIPGPTPTLNPCLNAAYVSDVTVPDGFRFNPSVSFVKIWRVKNSGTCDWDYGVRVGFQSGDKMDAPSHSAVGYLKAGQQTEVRVSMNSPSKAGTYKGIWRMTDAGGNPFGEELSVIIVVGSLAPPTSAPLPTVRPLPTWTPVIVSVPTSPPTRGGGGGGRVCCKVCTTGKACGDSCIARNKTCHQPPGCACDG